MQRFQLRTVGRLLAILAITASFVSSQAPLAGAQTRQSDAALIAQREATEKELESIAIIERKVMVPMRDGKRMQADIYRPKDESKKYPVIFVRTPYNFNFWDVDSGCTTRHEIRSRCRQTWLCLCRDERARTLFFRRRLRHSGAAVNRFR